jgi:hypothetical protein
MRLEHYRMKTDTVAVLCGKDELVVIPAGSVVLADGTLCERCEPGESKPQLTSVVWNDQNVSMFVIDFRARAELVSGTTDQRL